MPARFRYRCGGCRYRTPWRTEAEARAKLAEHGRRRHGGHVRDDGFEIRQERPEGTGLGRFFRRRRR